MNFENGQDKRNSRNRQKGLGKPEEKSAGTRYKQNQAFSFDSQRANINESNNSGRRRAIVGGILSQLREDCEDQLAFNERQIKYHKAQIDKLKKKIKYLNGLELLRNEQCSGE